MVLFALQALPPGDRASAEAQISACEDCRQEIETLRPIIRSFVGWSTDVLRPAESLWGRLAQRIAGHRHADIEELHLLHGILKVDD